MAIHSKKRDRANNNSDSIIMMNTHRRHHNNANQEEEYESAVAFLREFHSRRGTDAHDHLHSMSLDAILETDHFDEMLASDFSLALSFGKPSSLSSSANNNGKSNQLRRHHRLKMKRNPSNHGNLSRMKKATTSKCLLDLDDSISSTSSVSFTSSSSSSSSSSSGSDEDKSTLSHGNETLKRTSRRSYLYNIGSDDDDDFETESYYLGYDESPMPMTKRHCSSHT